MKVIKAGQVPEKQAPWWVGAECECSNCGCRFELEQEDLHRNATPVVSHRVPCPMPHCGQYVTVPVSQRAALETILKASERAREKEPYSYLGHTVQMLPDSQLNTHKIRC